MYPPPGPTPSRTELCTPHAPTKTCASPNSTLHVTKPLFVSPRPTQPPATALAQRLMPSAPHTATPPCGQAAGAPPDGAHPTRDLTAAAAEKCLGGGGAALERVARNGGRVLQVVLSGK